MEKGTCWIEQREELGSDMVTHKASVNPLGRPEAAMTFQSCSSGDEAFILMQMDPVPSEKQ